MNEIEVPLKITGIGAIKKELRDLKGEIANATDSESIARLSQRAGELKDQLADANEQVNIFASGSKFEQVSNGLGSIKDSIMSLDFAEAGDKAKLLTTALKGINPAEFATQFKGFGQVMLSLGSAVGVAMKQFIAFGISLLANPIFLLVAVIVAIVAAILLLLHKMGILKKIFDAMMIPINALIQGFKDLTDWLGLTSYAAEENAARTLAANEKVIESSKERQAALGASFDYEIKMAKIAGKETLGLELEKSRSLQGESKKRLTSAQAALKAQLKLGEDGDKEVIKKLKQQIKEERALILEQVRDRKLIVAQNQADKQKDLEKDLEQQKANAEKIANAQKAAAEKARAAAKKFAEDRLAAQRTIADIEIALIKNDNERETATINEKYIRQMQDLQKNENLTAQEKTRLSELYRQQLEVDLKKQEQTQIDAEKAKQQKILDLIKANQEAQQQAEEDYYEQYRLQVMSEQGREIDAVNSKYFQLIAKAEQFGLDTKILKEQQEKELADINKKYADKQAADALDAENKKRQAQLDTVNGALKLAEDSTKAIQAVGDIAFQAKMAKVKKGSKEEEELAKKQFKFNKAMQLSGAIIDAGKAITASLAASPLTILGVPSPGGIAALVATAATSAANIAKIASTQFTSTGGGGGGNQPTIPEASSSSTTSATPAFNLFGQSNNMNNVGPDGQTQTTEITVNAVVSETELTNTQNKVAKINQNATL
jgi:DNA repair exonuclease SbcCD ATPase subunit